MALLLGGCSHEGGAGGSSKGKAAPAPIAVTVVPLERRSVERVIDIEGTLKAWEVVSVSAKKGGLVLKVAHDMGDRVKPGELLVELDPVDEDLAVRQADARYIGELAKLGVSRSRAEEFVKRYGENEKLLNNPDVDEIIVNLPASKQAAAVLETARQEYARQKSLSNRGVGTDQAYLTAQNDYDAARAALDNVDLTVRTNIAAALASRVALDLAEQDRSEMSVLVPHPGSLPPGQTRAEAMTFAVSRRLVHEGQRIKDGEAVFELVVEDPVRLWVNVPERHRPEVEVGQTVRITAMSRPGETFLGQVARINPAVDPESRSFQVESLIPNTDGKLRPGGFAKGQIVLSGNAQAVVVPVEAVYRFAGVTKIYLVVDGQSRGLPVILGQELDDGVEVVGDGVTLPEEGQVVDTGQSVLARLAEGTPVVIRQPDLTPIGGPREKEGAGKNETQKVQPVDTPPDQDPIK